MMNIYEKIFSELNKAKIKYLIVGGVAVNLHGYLRFTSDIDILLALDTENLDRMEKLMSKLNYGPRVPVELHDLGNPDNIRKWLNEKGMKVYTFMPNGPESLQIDILTEESVRFQEFESRQEMITTSHILVPVISIQDLIVMKKNSDRFKDLEDLKQLLALKGLE